jgi:hypothetical protein
MIINNYRYSPSFGPILLEGMTVTLKGSDFPPEGKNFLCLAVDALPEYITDFGSLTAGTWSNDNEDENLELDTNELGQLRMMVLDDIRLRLKNPAPVAKWRTAKTTFYLPQFPTESGEDWYKEYLFRLSEIFYFEDTTPRFDLYSASTITVARIKFTGWKYKLESITQPGQFTILTNGWVTSK